MSGVSGRRSKKNQRIGSSRRGPKGLNRNIEKDDDDEDDRFQQTAESGDGKNEFHTTSDYHSAQFDHPPSSSIDQQTSALECPPHARTHKDSLMETELPEGKRKMGSTRKSAGGFKVERKLDDLRTTEELDEYVSQPNISATEEQHSSLRGDKQSSFPSNLSLHAESYGLGGEYRATLMDVVSENEEKDAIQHQEITSHSYEVVSAMVSESDLLREDPVMFNKLKPLSGQETPLASTTGQKRRMGSTRRPLRGKNSENVGVQEHSRSMTENERKAEAVDKAKFIISEEMAQMWDDVLRDAPSSHTETSNEPLLAERAELKEPDVSAGTETKNQSVAFPLVNPEKPLPETSSHNGTPLLNKGLDFKFGSHMEDFNVLNKVLENDNQHVPDKRNDTNTFHDCRDVNTAQGKEEVLMQKEEPSRNKKTSSLSPRHDAQLEELVLNCEESPSLSQHTDQLIEGGNMSFDVPAYNISHAEPTATNSPHEMNYAVKESQAIYVEMKHKNNVCDVASITCDTLTDLEYAYEDERGSETDNVFEIIDQCDARDHNVTQIIMESRNNKEDGGMSTETVLHQQPCEVSKEKEELHREREYSSTISQIKSGPSQDNAWKMLENKEVREDKEETQNTIIIDVSSKSEEMLSFEDSATDTGSHAHQQSLSEEGYDFSEHLENVSCDGSVGRSEETEVIEGMGASLLILEVEKPLTNINKVCNDSESNLQIENPDQNRVLTEEQNDTSSDINQEAFQVSDNLSAVIDSSPLLHVAVGSEETDTIAEESDISLVIPECSQDSYKLTTFHSETQLNEGDAEIVPVEGDTDLEIQTELKSFYSFTSEAVGSEENSHVSVSVREFNDTVTVESNRTTESDFLQTSSEALKVSENPENEVSSDNDIIPEDSHREEANTKSSPVVYKRKMGSTRRPVRGDAEQRKRREYDDENETFSSESMINVEKETFSLEDEPSPSESKSQSSKDGAKDQEINICEKNKVGPAERSESDLMHSSFSLDSVSEESTALTLSHITESQTLTKINQESQEKTGEAERAPAEGDVESNSEIQTESKTIDLTSEGEGTEGNICEATVIVKEIKVIGDKVTVDSDMITESGFHQNASSSNAHVEDFKVSENVKNTFSGETDTITEPSDINIIPEGSLREELQAKSSPVVYKRKIGSTRRPLRGDTGQRKKREYDDENETFNSEIIINVEKETFSLEDEPILDKSTSQNSNDGGKELEMEICENDDVGPPEGSESDLMQSSFSLDSVSKISTAVTISHITESQTLTKMNDETENAGEAERVPAKGEVESHSEIKTENKTTDLTTSEAERTEENILDATVLVREVEFTVDTVTEESSMSESDLLQNDTFTDAKLEALKVSENNDNASSVTDSGLLVHDNVTEGSRETDTIPDRNDTNIIPEDTQGEAAHSKPSPIVHKRKMGSTRRPLKGNKGQRKGVKYDGENETLDSEFMINVEKQTFSLEDEPSPDKSTSQSSKDGAKEQEMEISEKNYVGPVERSESDLMQSSFSLNSVSEESTGVTVSHITESQTLTNIYEESQDNTRDAEKAVVDGDSELCFEIKAQNQLFDSTTCEAEEREENSHDASVSVREDDVIGNTVTVEMDMTTKSVFLQSSPDVNMEVLNVSENAEKEVSGETDTILKQSDTNIIPKDTNREETHSILSPVVHKRKMGSTRRPLKGNKGQIKEIEHHDENKMHHDEREILVLEDAPSPDESSLQNSKDGAKDQEMEIFEKNKVGPAEGSESDLMQSSFSLDSVSDESTGVTVSHITESQTLTKINQESQEKTGDAERAPAEGDAESNSEIQTESKTIDLTSEGEGTEGNICEATVIVKEIEVIGDKVTVDSDMITESDFHQNASSSNAHVEDFKVSENVKNTFSGETDTITEPSDINIIPEGSLREELQAKSSPVVYKRKIGSTRRPVRGDTEQRKKREYDDENETFNSESMINVEKETFSLEDEPTLDKSTSQNSNDGGKELEMEICEKNDVGPPEGSESDLMQSSFSLDSVSKISTAVTISHITESQTLTKMNDETENAGDAERVPAKGEVESHSEIQTENKTTDLTTSEAERTEENIPDVTVIVREVEFTVDTVTEESSMSESDLLQNDTFTDAKLEALKVSENNDNASCVTDSGRLVHDNVTEGSRETDTIPDRNDTNIIPEDTQGEAAHSKPSPIVHKRKMGSTRRPFKGNKGQRKGVKYDDENETLDSECMINVEKQTFSLEDEPSPDKSTSQSSKDGAKEQEMEISEKNYVGPVERSESDLMQSSFSLDSVSEESTGVTVSHITESQTLTKINQESQEKTGDAERAPAEGDVESNSEIQTESKTIDLTSEGEGTEGNICKATVIVKEIEVIGDKVTVDSDMITESDFHQNASSSNAHVEDFKVSENVKNTFSGETDTITEPSDINIIPEGSHREELQAKSGPVVYKRKIGSTRRPLRGDTGQRKKREYDDENETFNSESMINVEKETFSLEDEPTLDKSTSQNSNDGGKELEMEICKKNDVGPAEGSESDLMQSSFSLDSVSKVSTAVTISHITKSQTLTKMNDETENAGDGERVPAKGEVESHSEIQTENKTTDLTTSEAERTEENIPDVTVIVREVEFTVDTVTEESSMSESDLLQNDTFTDAKLEALKVSENNDNASSVTDSGLLMQDNVTEGSRETDTIPDRNDTNLIPEDTQGEAAHSKSSPIVHKRKMGSTRRPFKGNKGQRKGVKYDDENETLDSECMINVEKQTFSLEDEPSPDKSTSQSSKDGAKEQEMEISEKNYGGPVERSESDLMQSLFSLDSVSEESTGVTVSHITESQTLTNIYEESQDNTRDAEKAAVDGDSELCFEIKAQNQLFDSTTCEAEEREENSHDASVSVREDDVIGNTVTVEMDMTTKSVFLQSSPDVNMEVLNVSENAEKEVSGETDTILKQSDINIIPKDTNREETHSILSPVVHKRKMGSTRRPLKGNKGQIKEIEHYDENKMHHDEREILVLEDAPSPDESSLQNSKDGAKDQEMEIFEKNKVGPAEGSESDLMQSSFSLDSVSEESTGVTVSHITESQTLTKMNDETENAGEAERVPAKGEVESHSEIQTENKTDTIPDQNDTNIIPEDNHIKAAHSKPSPIVHKRKMGSTRRPLKGNKGQRKGGKYDEENETLDSECMINVEKETFSLEEEPSPDKSTSQSSKDAQKLTDVKRDSENVSFVTDTGLLVQYDATEGYSNVTTESDFHQNAFSHLEELKVSENVENKVSGERDTITEPSEINIIPEHSQGEEVHAKCSPVVHKRKMGSTRRPLRGNKGQRNGEENTETLSEIQDQDNVVGHNMTQEICNIRDDDNEERMTTMLVGMSVQLCDDLKQKHRSDVSQTQTDPSQIDTDSLEVPERTADFVRDSLTSHSDLVLSDALSMEETQIHVSSEDFVMGDTWIPPTEVAEMHSVSSRSLQKRKMGSTRKRGKRIVNEEEVEEEKEGEAENTTIDDGTTKSEKTLTLEEAITGSLVHQQAFQRSDVQTEKSEQNDQNQAAEIVSDLPLGDVETYSVPEQSEIISIIPEESHRKDVQSNSIPVVLKRKMGSSRKTLKGNKGQRREVEPKKMDGESKGIAKEQDTGTQLAISEGENKWKLDEDVEQNFPVEFSSNMLFESEDGVKEVSLNINNPPEVSEEKGLENTVNDSNSLNEAINLYEGTMDTFVLTVSHEDVHQTMSAEYLDQHVHGGSEIEQTETMCHVFTTQELKNTQDYIVHENSSQKIPCTKEKRRKMGSTRRNPQVMHGKDMGDQDDILGMAMERETKKAENLDDMPLASSISQPKEMSSEAFSTTDLELEMSVSATDLKRGENYYQNNSDSSGPSGPEPPENTLQIKKNQLVSADVTKQLQPETVTVEKRRKMGSTRKNVREGGIRGKRDTYQDTETADTHLTLSQDSEMSLLGKAVGEQTIYDQSEDSLLNEIERALNKTSQSSSNYELNVNEPNAGDLENTPYLSKPENSNLKNSSKSLQPQPSQTFKTHSEPNSPERRQRKMGSTRRSPRQQLKAEREDEDKEDGEVEENSEGKKQEIKHLERVEVSVVHNIPENKLNKEHLNVPSAHISSSQLEESANPVVQERTSPSTKRKFGSRRTNKGKQGLGRLNASDRSELEDEVNDDLTVCDPYHSLQPENQPISKSISEQSNMEDRNEEAAPKGTGAGLVSLDQIIKRDRSTGTKQTINIQNRNNEVQFNVVMVGNSCVGKTSFIRRFHEGQFTEDYRSTIGVDTCMQTVVLPDRTVKLQIWDTAGQERFHSITRQVFHKADGLLLMYEITCSKSFISVRDWISQARERAPDDAIMILLGNKNDSVKREVQSEEGVDLAKEYNIHFMECSAATGANVSESMMTLAELLVQRKTQKKEHTILRREPPPKKSGCC